MDTHHRHRIVSAPTRQQLALRLRDLLEDGWEPIGDVALAKSTYPDEPPYYCVALREKTESPLSPAPGSSHG